MKINFIVSFILLISITLSSNELSWVDTQVETIKPSRRGVSDATISSITSPFIFLNDKKEKSDEKKSKPIEYLRASKTTKSASNSTIYTTYSSKYFTLSAIMNKSALINGKWYNLNDRVSRYKLSHVNVTSIELTRGNRRIVLSTNNKKRNLKFK